MTKHNRQYFIKKKGSSHQETTLFFFYLARIIELDELNSSGHNGFSVVEAPVF